MVCKNGKGNLKILGIPRQDNLLVIKERKTIRFVALRDVLYIESDGYLSVVYTVHGEQFSISKLLKYFESGLFSYGFLRVNRNLVVNISHVRQYEFGNLPVVCIDNNLVFQVARRRVSTTINYINALCE